MYISIWVFITCCNKINKKIPKVAIATLSVNGVKSYLDKIHKVQF